MDNQTMRRTVIAGGVLAMLGIAAFAGLWVFLGNAGASQFTRVVLSVCLPPILLAAGMGAYFVLVRPPNPPNPPDQPKEE